MIKAIETQYAGCRFRSRLEARWAVFFDAMHWAWEYEPEGFELGELGRYLPDFRVWRDGEVGSGAPMWIEIKGVEPTEREKDLILELFWCSRTPGAIFYGDIEARQIESSSRIEPGIYRGAWAVKAWATPSANPWFSQPLFRCYEIEGYDRENPTADSRHSRLAIWDWRRFAAVPDAVRAARSARFEHGESGAPR